MRIVRGKLSHFRNLEEADIAFSPRVNLFLGDNGQGKTNLLEALNYLALGRSHRAARNDDLIRFGAMQLHVGLTVADEDGGERMFEYGLERGGGRRFRIDGQAVRRRSELVGQLVTVFFSPDSIGLVRGGPDNRRRFVDQGLAGFDKNHLTHLQAHLRALRQKTRLLRDLKSGGQSAWNGRCEVEAWNRKLAHHAAPICQGRATFARRVEPHARQAYVNLAAHSTTLEFTYKPSLELDFSGRESVELEKEILAVFDYIMEDELRRGRPLSGPQMDDFEVRLAGRDLRIFGSQGETRTAALSLIMAQSDVVFEMRRVRPILFFDDIFSELDRNRSRRLQEQTSQWHQIFIATARSEDVTGWQPEGLRVWEVKKGKVCPQ
jgi:DNA replication and repair protein RecF